MRITAARTGISHLHFYIESLMGELRGTTEEDDTLSVFGDEDTLPNIVVASHQPTIESRNNVISNIKRVSLILIR